MDSVGSLWRSTWKLYADRFVAVTQIILPPLALLGLGDIFRAIGGAPFLIIGSVSLAAGVLLSIVANAAILRSFHYGTGFEESYRTAAEIFWRLISVSLLVAFATVGAFAMFIIPGVWLMVGFIFANYALVLEEKHGFDALLQSREYVRGYWWAMFGRLILIVLAFGITAIVVNITFTLIGGRIGGAIASTIITLVMAPLLIAYYYTMYRNIIAVKQHAAGDAPKGSKAFIVVAQAVGILVVIAAAIGVGLAMKYGGPADQMAPDGYGRYGNYGAPGGSVNLPPLPTPTAP